MSLTSPTSPTHASGSTALLVLAHGSRDPRHAATVTALCARVARLRPRLRVEPCFLEFNAPSVPRALERLRAEGVRDVVAVPLLLSRAFHAKTDIPGVLADARLPGMSVRQAGVLGPHPLLASALERRLHEAGLPCQPSSTGVVLAAAGSSDPEAIAAIAETAREWRRTAGWCAVRPAFASVPLPGLATTGEAVRALRAEGVRRVAVAPYMIAPGFLPDRVAAGARDEGADVLAPVLGSAPEVARLLLLRYELAVAGPEASARPASLTDAA